MCYCFSGEISEQWVPFIELVIFFIFQGFNVGAHFGVWIVAKTKVIDLSGNVVKNVSNGMSTIFINNTWVVPGINGSADGIFQNTSSVAVETFKNVTFEPEEIWEDLTAFRGIFYLMCIFGAALFIIQLCVLIPNVVKHLRGADPASLKDESAPCYYRNVFFINVLMLLFTTIVFDVPIAMLTVRLVEDVWKADPEALSETEKVEASQLMISLSLAGLALMAFYKGMMPLFIWIGNPFCFPCVWLRLFVVLPGGLVALVMTFAPPMGYAKHSLLTFAPPALQAAIGGVVETFFSIGTIFWGVFIAVTFVVVVCYYKFCYEGSSDGKGVCCCC